MILLDVNLLLYAFVGQFPQHEAARRWLDAGLARAPDRVGPDAHLAALAIEHDLTLCSTDRDFARFSGLRWLDPLTATPPPEPDHR